MKPQVISFHCILRNQQGEPLSSSYNGEVIAEEKPKAKTLRGLVKGLRGLKPGERRRIFVPAAEAYGFYKNDLVVDLPRDEFPDDEELVVGAEILGKFQGGPPRIFRVVDLSSQHVTLDGNHPLAGQDLIFDVEGTEVREATPDDVGQEVSLTPMGYLH